MSCAVMLTVLMDLSIVRLENVNKILITFQLKTINMQTLESCFLINSQLSFIASIYLISYCSNRTQITHIYFTIQ